MHNARIVLTALESCFDPDEIVTLVARTSASQVGFTGGEPIKVVHRPSGREFFGEGHPSQIQNKIAGLLQLLSEDVPRMMSIKP